MKPSEAYWQASILSLHALLLSFSSKKLGRVYTVTLTNHLNLPWSLLTSDRIMESNDSLVNFRLFSVFVIIYYHTTVYFCDIVVLTEAI